MKISYRENNIINKMDRLYSIIRSPHDDRDYRYEALKTVGASSTTFDLRDQLLPPRDQGSRGTCAAFTAAAIKEYQEKQDHPDQFSGYMSPDSVYFYRENKPSPGMYCRDVMKILQKKGACRESLCPYGPADPIVLSNEAVYDAARFKISSYAQISTIDAVKHALQNEGPVLVAFPVYQNDPYFWRPKGSLLGGHALTCVGWNEEGFILRNSWGSDWNGDGHVIWPWSDFGMHWEIWSSIDTRTEWDDPAVLDVPPPPPPPPPKKAKRIVPQRRRVIPKPKPMKKPKVKKPKKK